MRRALALVRQHHCFLDFGDALSRSSGKFAFPDADDDPPAAFEQPHNLTITSLVASDLFTPKPCISFWNKVSAAGVTMPKASIHKCHDPASAPHEIRFAGQRLVSPPTGQTSLPKQRYKSNFGRRISGAANASHQMPTC
jgi:hypothetical protein